jgi:glycosyltransferase involved in cell wall biosynthesis
MICFINYSISPYHLARFKAVKDTFQDEILFIELASKDKIYEWKSLANQINAICLFPNSEFSQIPGKMMVSSLKEILDSHKPDTVLSISYATPAMRYASLWARFNGAVSICVNDSWKGDKPRFFLWEILKGLWCRLAYDGMFLSGVRSLAYYHGLGFPKDRIWLGQNTVDNDFYFTEVKKIREREEDYRRKYSLPDSYFLCVARLSKEKNLERFIRAYRSYKNQGGSWQLVITGSGPLEGNLRELTRNLNIEQDVIFSGWKQLEEMPVYYGLAKCLVLPSISETWGNVVNEAMACGLPVLVSDKCGCQPELCFRGVNGFDFSPYDLDQITTALLKISSDTVNLSQMGAASLQLIQRFTTKNYALSLKDCIRTLQKNRKSRR